jgi:divalent metal cation (Fe/Co/Zn/Cd) transporter
VAACRGRRAGTGYFVDLHLELPPRTPLARDHATGHRVKAAILARLPEVRDVLTHLEPSRRHRLKAPPPPGR